MRIRPRRPKIDPSAAEIHWVGGDPQTTHTVDVLSLLLPAGEHYFVTLFKQALPLVKDKTLRDDVRGFIGQEAQHAEAHQKVIDHFVAQGIDVAPYLAKIDWIFDRLLADAPFGHEVPARLEPHWLRGRIGIVAAIEHFTTMLGAWMLEAAPLVAASRDAEMIRLLEWHAAEEVEHRAVAFDLFEALGGNYPERVAGMLIVLPGLTAVWIDGVRHMMKADPTAPGPASLRSFVARGKEGTMPTFGAVGRAFFRYLRPSHHPRAEHVPARTREVLSRNDPPAVTTPR